MTTAWAFNASIVEDPEFWVLEFSHWAKEDCAFRDRCFGGLAFLHLCFSEWCSRVSVPCGLETFEKLLRLEGLSVAEGLVYGLIVKADAEYPRYSQKVGGQ
jgi:hypothetical protein